MDTCPAEFQRDYPRLLGQIRDLHYFWSKGNLPSPGGVMDQSAVFYEAVLAFDYGISEGRERLRSTPDRTEGGRK